MAKLYNVTFDVEIRGEVVVDVEAENEEEAILKGKEQADEFVMWGDYETYSVYIENGEAVEAEGGK
jgi:hypothetical protein